MSHKISRRELMKKCAIGGLSLGAGTLLTSCAHSKTTSCDNKNQKNQTLFLSLLMTGAGAT